MIVTLTLSWVSLFMRGFSIVRPEIFILVVVSGIVETIFWGYVFNNRY